MGRGNVATRSGLDTALSDSGGTSRRCRVGKAIKNTSLWIFDLLLLCGYLLPSGRTAVWTASLMIARTLLYLTQFLLVLGLVQAVKEQNTDDKSTLVSIINHLVGVTGEDLLPTPEKQRQSISLAGLGGLELPPTPTTVTTTWQPSIPLTPTTATTTGLPALTTTTGLPALITTTGLPASTSTTELSALTTTSKVFAGFPWVDLIGIAVVLTLVSCVCGGATWGAVSQARKRISDYQCETPCSP